MEVLRQEVARGLEVSCQEAVTGPRPSTPVRGEGDPIRTRATGQREHDALTESHRCHGKRSPSVSGNVTDQHKRRERIFVFLGIKFF